MGTAILTCGIFSSAGSVRAATFGFTLEGLTGSGTLQFDDRSLTGEDLEIVTSADFIDGSLSWNFLAGEADLYLGEDEDGTINIVPVPYFIGSNASGLVDRIDNFEEPDFFGESKFVFEKGVL
ncbi:MAG TPA: hypothetical protein IGS17_02375, partial [Oscillatoriales cyanobacterium M59_W2019_021]|nr:hypothetical protein [Oscillatoriales cyanobacterium M59_W2019_021]